MPAPDPIEWLAIPACDTPPVNLDAWKQQLESMGHPPSVKRTDGEVWLELPSLGVRGFVVPEGAALEAINFEVSGDPVAARSALEGAVHALGWELHDDDDDEEDDDSDED